MEKFNGETRRQIGQAVRFFTNPNDDRSDYILAINFQIYCDSLGVTDETAGSNFQKLFAQFADELSSLFISCHSFNSNEYSYNCGCSGYARDNVTFIAFTVADPSNPETFNNRKNFTSAFHVPAFQWLTFSKSIVQYQRRYSWLSS